METMHIQKPTHPSKERRQLERFNLRLPARIEELPSRPDHATVVLNLFTKDISSSGAFLVSERSLEEGTHVRVNVILTPEKPGTSQVKRALLEVKGTVIRKGPAGMAVSFEKRHKFAPLDYA